MMQSTRFIWKYREGEGRNPPCFWRLTMKNDIELWDIVYPYNIPLGSPQDKMEHPIGAIQVDGWVVTLQADEMVGFCDSGRPQEANIRCLAQSILDDLFDHINFVMPQAVS